MKLELTTKDLSLGADPSRVTLRSFRTPRADLNQASSIYYTDSEGNRICLKERHAKDTTTRIS